jgi:hypothetical protein
MEYIERTLGEVPKDNIVLRHLETPLTPLICWLENWYGDPRPFPAIALSGKSNIETWGFADEVASVVSPVGTMSFSEPPLPNLPIKHLASGEWLEI